MRRLSAGTTNTTASTIDRAGEVHRQSHPALVPGEQLRVLTDHQQHGRSGDRPPGVVHRTQRHRQQEQHHGHRRRPRARRDARRARPRRSTLRRCYPKCVAPGALRCRTGRGLNGQQHAGDEPVPADHVARAAGRQARRPPPPRRRPWRRARSRHRRRSATSGDRRFRGPAPRRADRARAAEPRRPRQQHDRHAEQIRIHDDHATPVRRRCATAIRITASPAVGPTR